MNEITVKTGRSYQVIIGENILDKTGKYLKKIERQHYTRAAIITDDMVDGLYGDVVRAALESSGVIVSTFVFPNGESSKSMATAMDAVSFLCRNQITRSDVVIALGGGVVGDLAGFAASIYLRSIDYIQIPTTLLAAVDSSVGGKTAVNIPEGKNLVGSFWQPRMVICDTKTMDTLSPEIFADGTAETIKYGCIWDKNLFALLEQDDIRSHLGDIIARCIEIKAQVVIEDERDQALRQILNFGHTTGHAIEKLSHFGMTHGKGVAIGMCLAAAAGEASNITPPGTKERIVSVLQKHNLPTACNYSIDEVAAECLGDKKRSGNTINFVLLQELGKALLYPVETSALAGFLSRGERS